MKLQWRAAARADLRTILAYISEWNVAAAERLLGVIESCTEHLPEHPFLYRSGRVPGTREAVVHPNDILIYRVDSRVIEVVSLVHARQLYP